jgi:hypothetical protein
MRSEPQPGQLMPSISLVGHTGSGLSGSVGFARATTAQPAHAATATAAGGSIARNRDAVANLAGACITERRYLRQQTVRVPDGAPPGTANR